MKRSRLFWLSCFIGLCTISVLADICSAQEVSSPRQLKNDSILRLESLRTGDEKFDKEIDKIIKHIQKSFEDKKCSLWIDDWHLVTATNKKDEDDDKDLSCGLKVFREEKKALKRLLKHIGKIVIDEEGEDEEGEGEVETGVFIISPEVKVTFEQVIEDLIRADRLLAERALDEAKVYQGIDKRIDHQIDKSENELTKAQNELQKDKPDKAIKKYEKAWEHAQLALKFVTPEIATQAANNWLLRMEEAFTTENQEQLFEAAAAIIEIGAPAIPSLVNVIQDKEKDWQLRSMAIELLSNVGDETAVEPLIDVLKTEERTELRSAAAIALGVIGSTTVADSLTETLQTESSVEVRQSAALSLGNIKDEKAINAALIALDDPDSMVRTDALRSLADLNAKSAIPQIVNELNDQDNYVRFTAAIVLGKIGDESVIDSLLSKLDDEDDWVRKASSEAIGKLIAPEQPSAIPALIEAINDIDWEVNRYAAEALIKISQPAVPEILTAYQSAGPNEREHIAYALGKIEMDDPLRTQVIETLRETLSSENKSDALNAAVALYRVGVIEETYNFALTELSDERIGTRESAAIALGEMGDGRAVPALEEALQDPELFVRDAASVALEKITGRIYEYQQ